MFSISSNFSNSPGNLIDDLWCKQLSRCYNDTNYMEWNIPSTDCSSSGTLITEPQHALNSISLVRHWQRLYMEAGESPSLEVFGNCGYGTQGHGQWAWWAWADGWTKWAQWSFPTSVIKIFHDLVYMKGYQICLTSGREPVYCFLVFL